jgi:hypothetical protein
MRTKIIILSIVALLVLACGTSVSSLDEIQDRLNRNKCRMNREDLVFAIQGLEYEMDTVFTSIPQDLLDDSLLICPADSSLYVMITDGDNRRIQCSFCGGDSSF